MSEWIYIRDQYIRIFEYSNIFVTLCSRIMLSTWHEEKSGRRCRRRNISIGRENSGKAPLFHKIPATHLLWCMVPPIAYTQGLKRVLVLASTCCVLRDNKTECFHAINSFSMFPNVDTLLLLLFTCHNQVKYDYSCSTCQKYSNEPQGCRHLSVDDVICIVRASFSIIIT